jgi:hypothetical protein
MGRPINKRYIGNTTGSGQQISATAYIPGSAGPSTAWLQRQVATNTYQMTNIAGINSGRCQLVQGGVALLPGQANITVTPYGSSGSGATADALMGVDTAYSNVIVGGGLNTGIDYEIGDILSPTGGTYSQQANLTVTGIQANYVSMMGTNAGADYDIGNYIEFGGAGWISNLRVSVNNVNVTGAITEFVHVVGPNYLGIRDVAAPVDPLSGGVTYTGSGIDANGAGATFKVQWGVSAVTVTDPGVYSTLPGITNVATTTDSATGTGATVDLTYLVSDVDVTNGGTDFDQAQVTFSSGSAAALATTNAAGSVTTVTITASGAGYTSIPDVTVAPLNSVQYAAEIRDNTVTTFDNNTYVWIASNIDLTESNQARIQTS